MPLKNPSPRPPRRGAWEGSKGPGVECGGGAGRKRSNRGAGQPEPR